VTLRAGEKTPIILALDLAMGSVGGDSIALVGVSRWGENDFAVKFCRIWDSPGTRFDFDATVGVALNWLLANTAVLQLTYDPFQCQHFAAGFKGRTWLKEFPQGNDRSLSDKFLYDCIASKRLHHNGDAALKKHILNAGAKSTGEADKLRIVKTHPRKKIDAAVALSMGVYKCSLLNLPSDPVSVKTKSRIESEQAEKGEVSNNDVVKIEYIGNARGEIMTVSGLKKIARGQEYIVPNQIWEQIKEYHQDKQWRKI
jgi:hypothetical protein